jgi:hypothetical protein
MLAGRLGFVKFGVADGLPLAQTSAMKPSERILAYCAVLLTFMALTVWLKFFQVRPHPPRPPEPMTLPRLTKHPSQPATNQETTSGTTTGASTYRTASPLPSTVEHPLPAGVQPGRPVPAPVKVASAATRTNISSAVGSPGGSVIRGTVFFQGTTPVRKKIKTDADPHCAGSALFTEDIIVNSNRLQNVFVYIASGLEGQTFNPPRDQVILNQKGCSFVPHVLGMQAGQVLLIRNSDGTLHNIHALATNNSEFNNGQPTRSADLKKTFRNPEVMIPVKCDVHPWMQAFIGVLDHPFFDVTREDGSFALPALPAGNYTVAAWHEKLGSGTQIVELGGREVKDITFVFEEQ